MKVLEEGTDRMVVELTDGEGLALATSFSILAQSVMCNVTGKPFVWPAEQPEFTDEETGFAGLAASIMLTGMKVLQDPADLDGVSLFIEAVDRHCWPEDYQQETKGEES